MLAVLPDSEEEKFPGDNKYFRQPSKWFSYLSFWCANAWQVVLGEVSGVTSQSSSWVNKLNLRVDVVVFNLWLWMGALGSARNDNGIDKSIFVKPATFHLTLLMLKLWNEDRVRLARDCLQVGLSSPYWMSQTSISTFNDHQSQQE